MHLSEARKIGRNDILCLEFFVTLMKQAKNARSFNILRPFAASVMYVYTLHVSRVRAQHIGSPAHHVDPKPISC